MSFLLAFLQWDISDAEIRVLSAKSSLLLEVPSFMVGSGQNIALHASHIARNSVFLISVFPVHPLSLPPYSPPRQSDA